MPALSGQIFYASPLCGNAKTFYANICINALTSNKDFLYLPIKRIGMSDDCGDYLYLDLILTRGKYV